MVASNRKKDQIPPVVVDVAGLVPRQRGPLSNVLRRFLPSLDSSGEVDLDVVCADLVEVAVWTSQDGGWQEHASFLLGTSEGRWHVIGFSEPVVSELIPRLQELPGFDSRLLLDLIGSRTEMVTVVWKKPADSTESP